MAIALYVALWIGYEMHWNWLDAWDRAWLAPAYRYGAAHPQWVAGWKLFCDVLGPGGFRLVGLVVMVVAWFRGRRRTAVFVLLTVVIGGVVVEIAKALAERPRPITALAGAPGSSFPSGHAFGVLVSVVALLIVAWPVLGSQARVWWSLLGAVVTVLIGVGRVVLNVHHPSDVLAGWALGYAYVVVCALAVRRDTIVSQPLSGR